MSYRQYAAHRGCTLRAVQKAVGDVGLHGQRTGRIGAALVAVEGSPHPKIDSDKADALWLLNTDEAKRSPLFAPSDAALGLDLPVDDPEPDAPVDASDPESAAAKKLYHQSRALRSKVEAENAQLDLDIRKGKLIDLDDAIQLSYTALRTLRDAMRNVGARLSAQVASISDPYDCEQIINAEIDQVLASITPDKLLTNADDDDTPDTEGN